MAATEKLADYYVCAACRCIFADVAGGAAAYGRTGCVPAQCKPVAGAAPIRQRAAWRGLDELRRMPLDTTDQREYSLCDPCGLDQNGPRACMPARDKRPRAKTRNRR
jgi:hypothetical protein